MSKPTITNNDRAAALDRLAEAAEKAALAQVALVDAKREVERSQNALRYARQQADSLCLVPGEGDARPQRA